MNGGDWISLIVAIKDGDLAAVESFLQTPGVDDVDFIFDTEDARGIYIPLTRAFHLNHIAIVEVLLAHGAAVNGPVDAIVTPLQEACDR